VARLLGVPAVVTMQITTDSYGYTGPRQRFYERVETFFNDHVSSHVMFVSAHDLRRAGTPTRGSVVHNSVDVEALGRLAPARDRFRQEKRAALGLDPETPLVVSVGRLAHQKAPEVLVEAAAILREGGSPPFALVLVGDGEERAAVETRVEALRLGGIVHLAGAQPEASVRAWLMAADVFALASRFECFPLSILEACAAGLPCVVTDVGGNRESVRDGHNGSVVPPERPDLLAGALRPLLDRPDLRETMGTRALENARAFGTERMVAQVAERYETLCGRTP
jgi:glycosyltransferase involved in cell wall biosynthesis